MSEPEITRHQPGVRIGIILKRLKEQGLVRRYSTPKGNGHDIYRYQITSNGTKRLEYYRQHRTARYELARRRVDGGS